MGLIGHARWPGELPVPIGPETPAPTSLRRRFSREGFADTFNDPRPEVAAGKPRLIRSQRGPTTDFGTLNWASTTTAVAAYVVICSSLAIALSDLHRPSVPGVLAVSLLVGVVTGRRRCRGSFTGQPGWAAGFLVMVGVFVVLMLIGQLGVFGTSADVLLLAPCVGLFVLGLDWSWAQRLRVLAVVGLLPSLPIAFGFRAPLALVVLLVASLMLLFWSANNDVLVGSRRLAPLGGQGDLDDGDPGFEFTRSLFLALLLTLLLVPLLFLPALRLDFDAPSVAIGSWFGDIFGLILGWLASLFADVPPPDLDVPDWLRWLGDIIRPFALAARTVAVWLVPKIPYVIVATILFLLGRRTVRSWTAWQRALADRPWGARFSDSLEEAGRARGRRRRRDETVSSYSEALYHEGLVDTRLFEIASLAAESCFAPSEVSPDRQAWAEATFELIVAEHPSARWRRLRFWRTSAG